MIALIGSLSVVGYIFFSYAEGENEYSDYQQYMQVEDAGDDSITTLGSFSVDWDALRAINPDIVAWIYVPDTVINYPVAWRANDDSYYLKHTFKGNIANAYAPEYGCIMLSGQNRSDFSDQVNIIYGHNMRNGTMFNVLSNNLNDEFFNSHRVFYLLTPKGNYKLKSFACDRVRGVSTDIVIPNFETEEEFQDYVQQRYNDSVVTPDPAGPPAEDIKKVFAFSTCDYPDNKFRVITFCYIDEYFKLGKDVKDGKSEVSEGDVAAVENDIASRLN